MRTLAWCCVSIALLAAGSNAAPGQDIPWERVPGSENFSDFQRRTAETVLRSSFNYGGCNGPLVDCLRKNDPIAVRMAGFVSRRVVINPDANVILKELANRRLSATGPDTARVDLSQSLPCGSPDAAVTVIMYGDFNCPYCTTAATALRQLSTAYPDSFSFWFKSYPLAQDPYAMPAGIAQLAAERQGRGWEMFDGLFSHTRELSGATLENIADASGLDVQQYHKDINDPALEKQVRANKREANACGFFKMPGILINGRQYHGILSKTELWDRIQEERVLVARRRP